MGYFGIRKHMRYQKYLEEEIVMKSNHLVGISVIAPAYNEGVTIVNNVKSLLSLTYPKFEIIIVNDGSTDTTLTQLIQEFELIKVPFFYVASIKTKPVRGHYRSTNPVYSKLLVVDKENGKSKADASNAGINSAQFPLFLCTDVDCILKQDTLIKLVKPFYESKTRVIATGAGIRASNSSVVQDGYLIQSKFPTQWFPGFQELEYLRSFLIGRMAWTQVNGLLLVSGGLGLFDREIAIAAGGYWHRSLGEDMELIIRMRKCMYERKEKFKIVYIPESLCWTEVPATRTILLRQRVRWARGLIQTLYLHRGMFFNPKYGETGLLLLPYFFFYEFMIPLLEIIGLLLLVLSFFTHLYRYDFLIYMSISVYFFYLLVTLSSIIIEENRFRNYSQLSEISRIILMAILEPIAYHPFNLYASIKGYWHFFRQKEQQWGEMTRQGHQAQNLQK